MFNTVIAVIAIVAFVLPGFLVAQISSGERATPATESEWAVVLRALSFSVLIHLAYLPWTASIFDKITDHNEWTHHVGALAAYVALVVLITPFLTGVLLSKYLARVEKRGALKAWHYALGARDVRDAWDYLFQKLDTETFLIVRSDKELVAGKYTRNSWAGKTPSPHDLYLSEVWVMDPDTSEILAPLQPRYGVWFAADSIKDIYVAAP